jgi:hypothetical protein
VQGGEEGGAMMLKNWITVCLFAQNSNSPPQSATLDSGYAISRCVGRQALRKARQTISAAATWKGGGGLEATSAYLHATHTLEEDKKQGLPQSLHSKPVFFICILQKPNNEQNSINIRNHESWWSSNNTHIMHVLYSRNLHFCTLG